MLTYFRLGLWFSTANCENADAIAHGADSKKEQLYDLLIVQRYYNQNDLQHANIFILSGFIGVHKVAQTYWARSVAYDDAAYGALRGEKRQSNRVAATNRWHGKPNVLTRKILHPISPITNFGLCEHCIFHPFGFAPGIDTNYNVQMQAHTSVASHFSLTHAGERWVYNASCGSKGQAPNAHLPDWRNDKKVLARAKENSKHTSAHTINKSHERFSEQRGVEMKSKLWLHFILAASVFVFSKLFLPVMAFRQSDFCASSTIEWRSFKPFEPETHDRMQSSECESML